MGSLPCECISRSPIAAFSHLVPSSKLLEVRVDAGDDVRQARRGYDQGDDQSDHNSELGDNDCGNSKTKIADCRPNLVFCNNVTGSRVAEKFAREYLLPFVHEDLQQLADMVRPVFNFPRLGVEFRHVLDIPQQPGGLTLCASLLQSYFNGDWPKVDLIASCEAGGFVYGSALAARVDIPLALIREAGKLPPPTFSVVKTPSHISSLTFANSREGRIEMNRDLLPRGGSVVVVDDVLATGRTLCAILQLLLETGINDENISVMVVAEFPLHRGRDLLRQYGFGRVSVKSLHVFGCA